MKSRAKTSRAGRAPIPKQSRKLTGPATHQQTKSALGRGQVRVKQVKGSITELLASLGSPARKTKRGLSIATLRKRYKADRLKSWKAKYGRDQAACSDAPACSFDKDLRKFPDIKVRKPGKG